MKKESKKLTNPAKTKQSLLENEIMMQRLNAAGGVLVPRKGALLMPSRFNPDNDTKK